MKREHFGRPQDLTATQPISHDVLKEKYLKPGESGLEDVYRRVRWLRSSCQPSVKSMRRCSWRTCTRAPLVRAAS
jgi:hypothetical protein